MTKTNTPNKTPKQAPSAPSKAQQAQATAKRKEQERMAALEAIKRHKAGQVPEAQGKGRTVKRVALKPAKQGGELESFFWLNIVESGTLKFDVKYTRKELRGICEATGRWSPKGTSSNAPIDRLSQDLPGAAYCLCETIPATPSQEGSNIFTLNRTEYTWWLKEVRPVLVALGMAKQG